MLRKWLKSDFPCFQVVKKGSHLSNFEEKSFKKQNKTKIGVLEIEKKKEGKKGSSKKIVGTANYYFSDTS